MQQRLTEINHPDHTLITYPNLGHSFNPSSQWATGNGPIEPYVLADLYTWLEAHSGLSHPYVDTIPTDYLVEDDVEEIHHAMNMEGVVYYESQSSPSFRPISTYYPKST